MASASQVRPRAATTKPSTAPSVEHAPHDASLVARAGSMAPAS